MWYYSHISHQNECNKSRASLSTVSGSRGWFLYPFPFGIFRGWFPCLFSVSISLVHFSCLFSVPVTRAHGPVFLLVALSKITIFLIFEQFGTRRHPLREMKNYSKFNKVFEPFSFAVITIFLIFCPKIYYDCASHKNVGVWYKHNFDENHSRK